MPIKDNFCGNQKHIKPINRDDGIESCIFLCSLRKCVLAGINVFCSHHTFALSHELMARIRCLCDNYCSRDLGPVIQIKIL